MAKHLNFDHYIDEAQTENEVSFFRFTGEDIHVNARDDDYYILLLVESGMGIHTIDFKDYILQPKQFHFVHPQQINDYKLNHNVKGCGLMVQRHFFDLFLNGFSFGLPIYLKNPVQKLKPADFKILYEEFEAIGRETKYKTMYRELIIARFFVITFLISRISKYTFKGFPITRENPKMNELTILIDQHYQNERSVSFYAEKLAITPNYLNALCKRFYNQTATSMIDDRIILEAKRCLISGMSVKDTANALNFNDASYFTRFFKLHTTKTPKEFAILYKLDLF